MICSNCGGELTHHAIWREGFNHVPGFRCQSCGREFSADGADGVEGTADDLAEVIAGLDGVGLNDLEAAETARERPRQGVLRALEKRRAELAASESTEDAAAVDDSGAEDPTPAPVASESPAPEKPRRGGRR